MATNFRQAKNESFLGRVRTWLGLGHSSHQRRPFRARPTVELLEERLVPVTDYLLAAPGLVPATAPVQGVAVSNFTFSPSEANHLGTLTFDVVDVQGIDALLSASLQRRTLAQANLKVTTTEPGRSTEVAQWDMRDFQVAVLSEVTNDPIRAPLLHCVATFSHIESHAAGLPIKVTWDAQTNAGTPFEDLPLFRGAATSELAPDSAPFHVDFGGEDPIGATAGHWTISAQQINGPGGLPRNDVQMTTFEFTGRAGTYSPQLLIAALDHHTLDHVYVTGVTERSAATSKIMTWDLQNVTVVSLQTMNDESGILLQTVRLDALAVTVGSEGKDGTPSSAGYDVATGQLIATTALSMDGTPPVSTIQYLAARGQYAAPMFLDFGGATVYVGSAKWPVEPGQTLGELKVDLIKSVDSAQLFQSVVSGHSFDHVNFISFNSDNALLEKSLVLDNVVIKEFSTDAGPNTVQRSLKLMFSAVSVGFAEGAPTVSTVRKWDIASGAGSAVDSAFTGKATTPFMDTAGRSVSFLDVGGQQLIDIVQVKWLPTQVDAHGPQMGELQVQCRIDRQTPDLFLAMEQQRILGRVVVLYTGNSDIDMGWQLTDTKVTSFVYQPGLDTVTITFSSGALRFGQKTSADLASASWDARTNAGKIEQAPTNASATTWTLTTDDVIQWNPIQEAGVPANLGLLRVDSLISTQSPGYWIDLLSGRVLNELTVVQDNLTLKLTDVQVVSFETTGFSQTVGLKFTRIDMRYQKDQNSTTQGAWGLQPSPDQPLTFDAGSPHTTATSDMNVMVDYGAKTSSALSVTWLGSQADFYTGVGAVQVVQKLDEVAPELLSAFAQGHEMDAVRIRTSGTSYAGWDLAKVHVTSYELSGDTLTFTLNYRSARHFVVLPTSSGTTTAVTPLSASLVGGPGGGDAISNQLTVSILNAPARSPEGTPIHLNALVSGAPSQGVTYVWQVERDGSVFATGDADTFTFTPDNEGVYTVSLSVNGTPTSVSIHVTNVAPLNLNILGPGTIVNGQPVHYTGTFADLGLSDPHTLAWRVDDAAGNLVLQGAGSSFTFTPRSAGTYAVTFQVSDGVDSAILTRALLVANAPPRADAGGLYRLAEGNALALNGARSSDLDGDALTFAWDVNGDGVVDAAGAQPTLNWAQLDALGIKASVYTIGLTVMDGHGHSDTTSAQLLVTNVPPTAQMSGPALGVRNQPLSMVGTFTDPGETRFVHPQTWQVRDAGGKLVAQASGPSFTFTPTIVGKYTICYTVTDDDRATASVQKTLDVAAIALEPDPLDPRLTALVVGGTDGADQIAFQPKNGNGIEVLFAGRSQGTFYSTGRLIAYGGAGADMIEVRGNINRPSLLDGGAGNDMLIGGRGNNVLIGGGGDDILSAGAGRDLLIGGVGSDLLLGGADQDLLIGGATTYDANATALLALLDEWSSPRSQAVRLANLLATAAGSTFKTRLNQDYFPKDAGPGQTVLPDGSLDFLLGQGGADWLFSESTPGRTTHLR